MSDTQNVSTPDSADPGVLTYRQAADLLGCDVNTIRSRTETKNRYRQVPGSVRPAQVYAREVYEERAELLRKLNARDLTEGADEALTPQQASRGEHALLDEIASLRDKLARASEAARVLLMTDSAKNELVRQYLYDEFGGDAR